MRFPENLIIGKLIRRYKRFLADIELEDGRQVTAHVPNTGSMKSTNEPGSPVALSSHDRPDRKLKYTLELIQADGSWVGVNTALTNRIVEEAVVSGRIEELAGYDSVRREVKYGTGSRIDLLLEDAQKGLCYLEIKNVTYREIGAPAIARFPDAVTSRGTKHLRELMRVVEQGHRGVCLFLVNRPDCDSMAPAGEIDPVYAQTCQEARDAGVELLAYRVTSSPSAIEVDRRIPISLKLKPTPQV